MSAPTIRITPISSPLNSGVSVGNVPELAGTIFYFTIVPASASSGITKMKRPIHIAAESVVL